MSMQEKTTYVVVRQTGQRRDRANRDGQNFSNKPISANDGQPVDSPAQVTVSLQEKSTAEAQQLARDPNTLALARQMPLSLIEPCAGNAMASAAHPSCAWGVSAVGADTSRYTGQGVVVAVLDTGIDRDHPAFSRFDKDSLVEKDFTGEGNGDWHGHGTHCAATFFGGNVDGKRIGVAPGVSRVLIGKVIGAKGASTSALAGAMEWAAGQGAQIISMSLSVNMVAYAKQMIEDGVAQDVAFSRALKAYRENTRLFDMLSNLLSNSPHIGREALLVAAAGNASRRESTPPEVVAADLPAISQFVIPVGAIDERRRVAAFSNSDPLLMAPGVDILSACNRAGLTRLSGTSMAVPHVAGCAALWIEQQRVANRGMPQPRWLEQLRSALVERAAPLPGADSEDTGIGLVQAPQ